MQFARLESDRVSGNDLIGAARELQVAGRDFNAIERRGFYVNPSGPKITSAVTEDHRTKGHQT